jgi:molybdate transport system permease protein
LPGGWLPWIATLGFALFVGLPILALVAVATDEGLFLRYVGDPTVLAALRLSVTTSAAALALGVVLGTPTAYLLTRRTFPGRRLLDLLVDAPMVLPPAVAGVALLLAFGRRGVLGPTLDLLGVEVAFTSAAVILAQAFVATPFYVRAARAGFALVDREIESAAEVDGASAGTIFFRVTLPLALPALLGGMLMAWARALGEFGATIMFAGNVLGRTQTMPLAIYQAMESDLGVSITLAALLVVVSLGLLLLIRIVTRN